MLVDFDLTSSLGDTRRHRCYQRGCCPPELATRWLAYGAYRNRQRTGSGHADAAVLSWEDWLAAYAVLPASAFSAAQQPFCCIENLKIRIITVV